MTRVHNLILSSLVNHKKHLLLNTSFDQIINNHLGLYRISKYINPFDSYDTIIIDQSAIGNVPSLFQGFLSTIIVIDNVSQNMGMDDLEYWNNLSMIYTRYNNMYKCIFIAINESDYIRSNNAHNFYININDSAGWRFII